MKKVLITGANSYVGTHVEEWLMKEPDKYHVETLDMQDPSWKDFDFSKFDVVFHVAGIAHVSKKKSLEDLYYKVNTDLTIETAEKAKKDGVKQFIFMSSMIVYNSKETKITADTLPSPDNFYGMSKLKAEEGLIKLEDNHFIVSILRPPMIYGSYSKGNYARLRKLGLKTIAFPNYDNKRSMLYIDNLSRFVKHIIESNKNGLFYPQNKEYSCTTTIIKIIALNRKKTVWVTKLFNPIISLLKNRVKLINKVFGDFYYAVDKDILENFMGMRDSVLEIERNQNNE